VTFASFGTSGTQESMDSAHFNKLCKVMMMRRMVMRSLYHYSLPVVGTHTGLYVALSKQLHRYGRAVLCMPSLSDLISCARLVGAQETKLHSKRNLTSTDTDMIFTKVKTRGQVRSVLCLCKSAPLVVRSLCVQHRVTRCASSTAIDRLTLWGPSGTLAKAGSGVASG
jgi:hypothetical protein